jgi:hypothetical protein
LFPIGVFSRYHSYEATESTAELLYHYPDFRFRLGRRSATEGSLTLLERSSRLELLRESTFSATRVSVSSLSLSAGSSAFTSVPGSFFCVSSLVEDTVGADVGFGDVTTGLSDGWDDSNSSLVFGGGIAGVADGDVMSTVVLLLDTGSTVVVATELLGACCTSAVSVIAILATPVTRPMGW